MQLIVRTVNSTIVVDVEKSASVQDVKKSIEDVEFIPSRMIRLVKDSHEITGLLEGSVDDGDFLDLVVDVSGGMRAKWRKKRMRRLRRKRRKMRMRAR